MASSSPSSSQGGKAQKLAAGRSWTARLRYGSESWHLRGCSWQGWKGTGARTGWGSSHNGTARLEPGVRKPHTGPAASSRGCFPQGHNSEGRSSLTHPQRSHEAALSSCESPTMCRITHYTPGTGSQRRGAQLHRQDQAPPAPQHQGTVTFTQSSHHPPTPPSPFKSQVPPLPPQRRELHWYSRLCQATG